MASKRRLRRKRCESKFRHPTKDAALREAGRLRKRGLRDAGVYKCSFCKGWHVGGSLQQRPWLTRGNKLR